MAKKDTRKNILEAAEKLFSQNGFDGVPTKTIAREAGITEMTLFNHFKSKELLYKTVVKEKYLSTMVESLLSELSYDNLEDDLIMISKKILKNYEANKNVLMMRLKEKQSFQDDDTFKLEHDPILKQIIPVFKLYEKREELNSNSESSALLFLAGIKGILYVSLMENRSKKATKDLVFDYVKVSCHGLIKKS